MQLHYESRGAGEPVIILHGLFGSLDNWRGISRRLAERFRVLSVDQRNHGQSPHDSDTRYRAMAEDVQEFIVEHQLGEVCLIGHSMGAKTAMQTALQFPELVRRLVVVDMAPRAYKPRHERILKALLSLDLARYGSRQQIEVALAPKIPDLEVRRFLLKNVTGSPPGFRWKMGLHEIGSGYQHLTEPVSSKASFEKPTLFIRGEKSDFLTEADMPLIHGRFPCAVLRTIPAAGHWLHAEAPERFVAEVLDFLQG